MKRGVILLFFLAILSINLVYAAYSCSDDSAVVEDRKELAEGEKKNINGIGLALTEAEEITAISKITADLLVDAEKISLSDTTTSQIIELLNDDYNVSLENSTESSADLKVDGSSDSVNEGESETIGGLEVFLISADGSYPGTANLELLAGMDSLMLDSKDKPVEIVTADGDKYALELFSASDDNAIVIVRKCKTGDIEYTKDSAPVQNTTPVTNTTNTTKTNSSNHTVTITEVKKNSTCETIGLIENESYCDTNKFLVTQKDIGASCVENYECKSNSCNSLVCSQKSGLPIKEIVIGLITAVVLFFILLFFWSKRRYKTEEAN